MASVGDQVIIIARSTGEEVRVAAGLGVSVGERRVAAGSAVNVDGRLVGGAAVSGRGEGEGGGRVSIFREL